MNLLLRETLHRKIDSLPDIQLANVLAYIEHSQRPLPKGTSSEQLFEHAGAWGEEIGAEIGEIIARDCEAVHED